MFDPFTDSVDATKGQAARLNSRKISVNDGPLKEAMLAIGFAKDKPTMDYMMPYFMSWLEDSETKDDGLGSTGDDVCREWPVSRLH